MNKVQLTAVILIILVLTTYSSQSFAQSAGQMTGIMTLKVSSISPQNGAILIHFPAKLEIKVTRGGFPVQGARVQFWMQGGSHDAQMHCAFLTVTDLSGYAHLTLPNQNTLDEGQYIWYADATYPGFRGAASNVISFYNSFSSNIRTSTFGGTVSTDQKEYSAGQGNGASIVIYGNVNNYHLGQPIILKVIPPHGKTAQLFADGTYLGAFQTVYKLGSDSKLGTYTIIVYHNYVVSSTNIFQVVK